MCSILNSEKCSGVTRVGDTRAATEGVTPLFFSDFFLLIAVTITIAFYCFHSGVTPPGCHPTSLNYLSTILYKFAHFFSFGCHPPGGCHPGRSAPPPSDATGKMALRNIAWQCHQQVSSCRFIAMFGSWMALIAACADVCYHITVYDIASYHVVCHVFRRRRQR